MFGCCSVRALTACCSRSSRNSSHTSNWINTRTEPLSEAGDETVEDIYTRMVLHSNLLLLCFRVTPSSGSTNAAQIFAKNTHLYHR